MNINKPLVGAAMAIVALLILAGTLLADTADEIMEQVEKKARVETSMSELTMVVYPDLHNEENSRSYSLRVLERGDDSYMVFASPRTVHGLAMLSMGGDQWVFFPSTGRVRKIASRSRDSSIQGVGGDFSYEDMGGGDWRETYDFDMSTETASQWVLRGIPKGESGYKEIRIHILKATYVVERVEYYREDTELSSGRPFKELVMSDFRTIDGREVACRFEMRNLVEASKTVIITHEATYNIAIDDRYFNPTRFYR